MGMEVSRGKGRRSAVVVTGRTRRTPPWRVRGAAGGGRPAPPARVAQAPLRPLPRRLLALASRTRTYGNALSDRQKSYVFYLLLRPRNHSLRIAQEIITLFLINLVILYFESS